MIEEISGGNDYPEFDLSWGWAPRLNVLNDALTDAAAESSGIITERAPGLELYLDPAVVKSGDAARVRSLLENALASLKPA